VNVREHGRAWTGGHFWLPLYVFSVLHVARQKLSRLLALRVFRPLQYGPVVRTVVRG